VTSVDRLYSCWFSMEYLFLHLVVCWWLSPVCLARILDLAGVTFVLQTCCCQI
jgi:hypothetical protein